MNLDDIKPIGALIENSIRPSIEEIKWIIEYFDKRGIKIDRANIGAMMRHVGFAYGGYLLADALKSIICIGIICFTLWTIYRS